jgi:hypothetical protein
MKRMLVSIVAGVCLLLLLGAVAGARYVYKAWLDRDRILDVRDRIREVEAKGIEAVARIQGTARSNGRPRSASWTLNLAWLDAKGAVLNYDAVAISDRFARTIIVNDSVVRDTVRIKYLGAATGSAQTTLIVLDDFARTLLEEDPDLRIWIGIAMAGVAALGAGFMYLLCRRLLSPAVQV